MKKFCKKCRKLITGRDIYCGPCGLGIINQYKNMADEIKEEEIKTETEEGGETEEVTFPIIPEGEALV